MQLKVYGGTSSSIDLCRTCRNKFIVTGHRESEEYRECTEMGGVNRRVPFPVARCSGYIEDIDYSAAGALYLSFDSTENYLRVSKDKYVEGVSIKEFIKPKRIRKINGK